MSHTRTRQTIFTARALLILLALVAATAAISDDYLGSSRMYRFDRLTVVYPAGPGEPAEDNRLSAERRAAFLRNTHGVEAQVAADSDVSADQLKGHLLLLGWNNRLLGTEQAPSPISNDDSGRKFLDAAIPAGQDLLFIHDSPYNLGEKWLVFWSRIDLQLDRFQPLPLNGSDWALYLDYLAVRTGRLAKEIEWPPRRDPDGENVTSTVPAPPRLASEHFTLHYAGPAVAEADARRVLDARELALGQAVASLGAPPPGFRVDLFVYANRDDKLRTCGVPDPTHSLPRKRQVHAVLDEALGEGYREELHLLAHERFGAAHLTGFYEGLATALADESELPVFAALMLDRDLFPTLDELLDESSFRRMTRLGIGFPAAGLLMSWLHAEGGFGLVGRVYPQKDSGAAILGRALAKSATEADASFRTWATGIAESAQSELAFRTNKADAARLTAAGEHAEAAEALLQALEMRPEDQKTLYDLALAQLRAGKLGGAEKSLDRLIALAEQGEDQRYLIFGLYQKGRLRDRQGRRKDAVRQFERVLTLPDLNDVHRMAREQIEQLPE